jgi:hypothetical protein
MSRPSDWWVLDLGEDPTPGEPSAVRSMARSWGSLADDAEFAESRIRSLMGVGAVGDALRDKTGDLPHMLGKCKTSTVWRPTRWTGGLGGWRPITVMPTMCW